MQPCRGEIREAEIMGVHMMLVLNNDVTLAALKNRLRAA